MAGSYSKQHLDSKRHAVSCTGWVGGSWSTKFTGRIEFSAAQIVRKVQRLQSIKGIVIKFIYSENATKICKIFTLLLSYVVPIKSKVKISQNFVAFSEYMNFMRGIFVWYMELFLCLGSLNDVFGFFAGWGEQNCSFFLLKQHFIPLCFVESLTRYGLYQQCRLQSVGSHWNQTIGKYSACTQIIQLQDLGQIQN